MPGTGDRDAGEGADDEAEADGRHDHATDDAGDGGVRFTLPPIRLPAVTFPDDLRLAVPPPKVARRAGLSARSMLVAALLVDLADAWLALAGTGPVLAWGRVVAGLGLAALFAGVAGAFYAWEAVALALGAGWVTAVPTLSLLLLLRGRE